MAAVDLRKAVNGLDGISAATSAPAVLGILEGVLEECGAKFFCFNLLPVEPQKFEEVILVHRVPDEWMRLYLEQQYCLVDPSLRHCRRTTQPFEYLQSPYDPRSEPRAAEVIQRAHDFNLAKGFLVPVASPTGFHGNVWIGGYDLNIGQSERPAVHLLSLYAFERIRQLCSCSEPKPRITPRERDILTWAASGKTAWEIGEILHISKRTVDEHLAKVARKLNATNRPQAIARAIRHGLIEP